MCYTLCYIDCSLYIYRTVMIIACGALESFFACYGDRNYRYFYFLNQKYKPILYKPYYFYYYYYYKCPCNVFIVRFSSITKTPLNLQFPNVAYKD